MFVSEILGDKMQKPEPLDVDTSNEQRQNCISQLLRALLRGLPPAFATKAGADPERCEEIRSCEDDEAHPFLRGKVRITRSATLMVTHCEMPCPRRRRIQHQGSNC